MSKWTRRPDGKTVKRKSLRIEGQFAPRLIDMLEAPAYRVLNLAEHRVVARIEIELAHHGGLENGNLPVTYEQFAAYGVRLHSIAPAIRTLDALGFIKIQRGRGGNSEFRQPNRFELTYRHVQVVRYGDIIEPSNDWKRIKTLKEARQIAKAARSEKTKSHPTKRGVASPHETGSEADVLPPHERGGPSALPNRGVHLDSRGGGGGGDGSISNPAPGLSQDSPSLTAGSSTLVPFPGRRVS